MYPTKQTRSSDNGEIEQKSQIDDCDSNNGDTHEDDEKRRVVPFSNAAKSIDARRGSLVYFLGPAYMVFIKGISSDNRLTL
ncbi:BnaC09g53130D [Brassica napus]|uniref:BnaC09g53130D protein n=1 Tax=Brassica napus TaxID=3708 RepID=A0A078JG22_BRANA|nr:BnaC09g53130D [Brassica napus]